MTLYTILYVLVKFQHPFQRPAFNVPAQLVQLIRLGHPSPLLVSSLMMRGYVCRLTKPREHKSHHLAGIRRWNQGT